MLGPRAHSTVRISVSASVGRGGSGFRLIYEDVTTKIFVCQLLTSFELAVTEVFDENETAALTPEEIAAVPQETWETAKLSPIAALRLRRFDYRVDRFKECFRDGEPYPESTFETTFLAVYRQSYRVFWMNLNEPAYELLGSLVGGRPLGSAIGKACITHGLEPDELLTYFRDWMSKDLFASVG